jgi:hypothetical protein
MGEASRKSRSREEILGREQRCIYCANAATTIEHMPPLSMFIDRRRPAGLEFAACEDCNRSTSPADLVAGFLARIPRPDQPSSLLIKEAQQRLRRLDRQTPGLRAELFRTDKTTQTWFTSPLGLSHKAVQVKADGPQVKAYMSVFGGKLGMALYREHLGHALPLSGGVYTMFFLNVGLPDAAIIKMLPTLPLQGDLKQGILQVREQFAYRYNCDGKSIIAAIVGIHTNLHFFLSDPTFFSFPSLLSQPTADFVKPGELVPRVPQRIKKSASTA